VDTRKPNDHAHDFAEIANFKWSVKTIIASCISLRNNKEKRKTRKEKKRRKGGESIDATN